MLGQGSRSLPPSIVIVSMAIAAVVALALAGCGSNDDAELGSSLSESATSGGEEGSALGDGGDTQDGSDPNGPETALDTDSGPPDADADSAAGGTGGVDSAPEPAAEDVVASPLGLFLGDETYGAEWSPAAEERRRESEVERQQFIAECMSEAGFEYLPLDPAVGVGAGGVTRTVAAEQTRDWVERWGFGISTARFSQTEVGPGLVGHERPGPTVGVDDPNLAITSALSPQDLEAYFAALYGDGAAGGGFEVGGCLGGAAAASAAASFAFYDEFSADLDALYGEVDGDRRLVEAEDQVRACVTGAGVDYLAPGERFRYFDAALSELAEEVRHPSDDLSDRELALLSADEVDELISRPRELSAAGLERLGAIQAEEVGLAVAVHDCGGGDLARAVLRSQVTAEYEEQFLADHADRLEPFRAS